MSGVDWAKRAAKYAARDAAVDVFRELGWEETPWDELMRAPLGTQAQRKVALAGLKSGELWPLEPGPDGDWGYYRTDADLPRLAVFAARVGVSAQRAASLFEWIPPLQAGVIVDIAAERGEVFAAELLPRLGALGRRRTLTDHQRMASASVVIGETLALPVDEDVEWLRDWAIVAEGALAGLEIDRDAELFFPPADALRERFGDHAGAAVRSGVSPEGALPRTLVAAHERGWLSRERLLDLGLVGLDTAPNARARRGWWTFLSEHVLPSDEELAARIDELIPALSGGDGPLVQEIVPRVAPHVPTPVLADLALAVSAVSSRGPKAVAVAALAALPRPDSPTADAVLEVLGPLDIDTDARLAKAAASLRLAWEDPETREAGHPQGLAAGRLPTHAPDAESAGVWRPTPSPAAVERVELPAGGIPALAACARDAVEYSVTGNGTALPAELMLAMANALAAEDPDAVRAVLPRARRFGGSSRVATTGLDEWLDAAPVLAGRDTAGTVQGPTEARDGAVYQRLGRLPVLLSTPSFADLRIDPADLTRRLARYRAAGVSVVEGDLTLALLRTDPALGTPELVAELEELEIPVLDRSDAPLLGKDGVPLSAGALAAAWLREPLLEPAPIPEVVRGERLSRTGRAPRPDAARPGLRLPGWWAPLPERPFGTTFHSGTAPEHTAWWVGDTVRYRRPLLAGALGVAWRPELARDLMARATGPDPDPTAVMAAFERGILRPEALAVPEDIHDETAWAEVPTASFVAIARGSLDLAQAGLASVAWAFLELCLASALRAARLPTGTADLAEAMLRLAPGAAAAVRDGVAGPEALRVASLRALAARSGSSRAVRAARDAVERLGADPALGGEPQAAGRPAPPERKVTQAGKTDALTAEALASVAALRDEQFVQGFAPRSREAPYLRGDERFTLRAEADSPGLSTEVTLPSAPGVSYVARELLWNDFLVQHGALQAVRHEEGTKPWAHFLVWDEGCGGLVECAAVPETAPRAPLAAVHVAAAVGALAPKESQRAALVLSGLAAQGRLNVRAVREAVDLILATGEVEAWRLAAVLEQDPGSLSTFWPIFSGGMTHVARAAREDGAVPRWSAKFADEALRRLPHLAEALRRGLIPAEAFGSARELAALKGSTAGVKKVRAFSAALLSVIDEAPVAAG